MIQKVNLLLVGADSEFKSIVHSIFGEKRFRVTGKSASLLDALHHVQSKQIDLVLVGQEFGDEEFALFVAAAHREGFTGLIFRTPPLRLSGSVSSFNLFVSNPRLEELAEHEPGTRHPTHSAHEQEERLRSFPKFTARQKAVLDYVCEGKTNQEVARHLKCTESGVKAAMQELFRKFGVRKRAQVVHLALKSAAAQSSEKSLPLSGKPGQTTQSLELATELPSEEPIRTGDFVIDTAVHRVWVRGTEINLRPSEFKLLRVFATHPGELLGNASLGEMLWQNATSKLDALRVLIGALRAKIETGSTHRYIVTSPCLGYRFNPSAPANPAPDEN